MKKYIYGTTELGEILFNCLKECNIEIDGFTVDKEYITDNFLMSYPVVPYDELKSSAENGEEIGIYVCIGYKAMNENRRRAFKRIKADGMKIESFIHPSAIVKSDSIGEGCLIFEQAYIGPYTTIGDGNIFFPKSMLSHHSNAGNFNFFSVGCSVAGNVKIGDNCFLGNNSTTKDAVNIGSYTLLGAGCYVSCDTNEYDVIVPARGQILENKRSIDFI